MARKSEAQEVQEVQPEVQPSVELKANGNPKGKPLVTRKAISNERAEPGVFGVGPHALQDRVRKAQLTVAAPFPTHATYRTGEAEVRERVAENL
jgi:hypothetical protein